MSCISAMIFMIFILFSVLALPPFHQQLKLTLDEISPYFLRNDFIVLNSPVRTVFAIYCVSLWLTPPAEDLGSTLDWHSTGKGKATSLNTIFWLRNLQLQPGSCVKSLTQLGHSLHHTTHSLPQLQWAGLSCFHFHCLHFILSI